MKPTLTRTALLISALLLSPLAAQAAAPTKAEYAAAKTTISADYKADKAACGSQSGNAKDICVEEAKAKEKIARAELEYSYTGKAADRTNILVAKAKAAYEVAKERCDDLAGNAKDVCRQ